MSGVLSVEALSEMISSKSSKLCPSRDSRDWSRYFSPLKTGSLTLSRGDVLTLRLKARLCIGTGPGQHRRHGYRHPRRRPSVPASYQLPSIRETTQQRDLHTATHS